MTKKRVKVQFTVTAEVNEGYLGTYSSYETFARNEKKRIRKALPSFLHGASIQNLSVGDVAPSNQQEPP